MLNRYIFKIGLGEISLDTTKKLSSKDINFLDSQLLDIYTNLNNRISESSAYSFNKAQINIPVFVSTEFIEYIEWINKIYKNHNDLFKPFDLKGDTFLDNVVIDKKNLTIVKLSDFDFESSYFKKEFILLQLIKLLKLLEIEEYSLNLKNVYYSKGTKYWKIFNKNYSSKLKNEFAVFIDLETEEVKHDKINLKKFGAIKDELDEIKGFLIGKDIIELSINSKLLKFIPSKSSLIKFLRERDLKLDID